MSEQDDDATDGGDYLRGMSEEKVEEIRQSLAAIDLAVTREVVEDGAPEQLDKARDLVKEMLREGLDKMRKGFRIEPGEAQHRLLSVEGELRDLRRMLELRLKLLEEGNLKRNDELATRLRAGFASVNQRLFADRHELLTRMRELEDKVAVMRVDVRELQDRVNNVNGDEE